VRKASIQLKFIREPPVYNRRPGRSGFAAILNGLIAKAGYSF
jgi:hypothetical protein